VAESSREDVSSEESVYFRSWKSVSGDSRLQPSPRISRDANGVGYGLEEVDRKELHGGRILSRPPGIQSLTSLDFGESYVVDNDHPLGSPVENQVNG